MDWICDTTVPLSDLQAWIQDSVAQDQDQESEAQDQDQDSDAQKSKPPSHSITDIGLPYLLAYKSPPPKKKRVLCGLHYNHWPVYKS